MAATDAVTKHFELIGTRGHEPLLEKITATLRFDVLNGKRTEHWFLSIKKGDIAVSRRNVRADVVIRGQRPLLEQMFSGHANAVAAMLRGELSVEGRPELLVQFQRLLPRPGDARTRGVPAGYARRQR